MSHTMPTSTFLLTRARRGPSAASRHRAQRGITLLMALGLIAFVTAAVLVSLKAVSTESALQAQERRKREAFFAAEAGMAEGREVLRQLATSHNDQFFDPVMGDLGVANGGSGVSDGYVQAIGEDQGLPSQPGMEWYQVLPWTEYKLTVTANGALDSTVTTANQELTGPEGTPILDYPTADRVRYRVFLVDDDDGDSNRQDDSNGRVWLISVVAVSLKKKQPYRTIIRALINNEIVGGASGDGGGDVGGTANTGGS